MQADNGDLKLSEILFQPSTIEGIDSAILDYIENTADIYCTTKDGFKKVPVLWISAERAYQRKHKKELMTMSGSLVLPVLTIERTNIQKDMSKKGTAWANIPPVSDEKGGSITIARRINQSKTSNFANADSKRLFNQTNFRARTKASKKVVYETITIPQPVYIEVNYEITLLAEYQQQINEMITPFITRPGNVNYFPIKKDGHLYEVFVEPAYKQDNNVAALEVAERQYKTTVSYRVLAYLIGDDKNQESPKIVIRENAVEVKIPREHVITGDILEHIGKKGFYRE
tara:strand:+ start:1121 stop:1978 length:858 start_codon:yes stop_codon:yes gene_type:complete